MVTGLRTAIRTLAAADGRDSLNQRLGIGPEGAGPIRAGRARLAGFTLIELLVVMAIISILLAIAVPIYQNTVLHARETVLRDDLFQLRSLIDQYTLDKQEAPQSLDDLVTAGYLRQLPVDPFTQSSSTWQTVTDDTLMDADQTSGGIVDVHSGATGNSSDGSAYSSW